MAATAEGVLLAVPLSVSASLVMVSASVDMMSLVVLVEEATSSRGKNGEAGRARAIWKREPVAARKRRTMPWERSVSGVQGIRCKG